MKLFSSLTVIAFIILFCSACSDAEDFSNQETYELAVGDEFELYYTTNSCCYYCFNEAELEHLKLVDEKTVVPSENGCDGCSYTEAFVFEAKTVGVDTIYLMEMGGGDDCQLDRSFAEKYVVTVK